MSVLLATTFCEAIELLDCCGLSDSSMCLFALPVAAKLELRSQQERDAKLMLIDAIAGIQQGLHPKVLQGILLVHLPGSERPDEEEEE